MENKDFNVSDGFFTESDIINQGSGKKLVYDPTGGADENTVNLPNVDDLLGRIQEILEYMCTDDVVKLKNTNYQDYEEHMEEKFESFSMRYFALFKKLLSGEDLTHLFNMIAGIERINRGDETIEEVEKRLGEDLAEEYIYPKINDENSDKDDDTVKVNLNNVGKKKKHKKKKK
jgi:hypothetical protein